MKCSGREIARLKPYIIILHRGRLALEGGVVENVSNGSIDNIYSDQFKEQINDHAALPADDI